MKHTDDTPPWYDTQILKIKVSSPFVPCRRCCLWITPLFPWRAACVVGTRRRHTSPLGAPSNTGGPAWCIRSLCVPPPCAISLCGCGLGTDANRPACFMQMCLASVFGIRAKPPHRAFGQTLHAGSAWLRSSCIPLNVCAVLCFCVHRHPLNVCAVLCFCVHRHPLKVAQQRLPLPTSSVIVMTKTSGCHCWSKILPSTTTPVTIGCALPPPPHPFPPCTLPRTHLRVRCPFVVVIARGVGLSSHPLDVVHHAAHSCGVWCLPMRVGIHRARCLEAECVQRWQQQRL